MQSLDGCFGIGTGIRQRTLMQESPKSLQGWEILGTFTFGKS
jgi:hypothetical protein